MNELTQPARRPFLRRLFTTGDGIVTIVAMCSTVWIARGCFEDRFGRVVEDLPVRVAAVETRLDALEKQGGFTKEERTELRASVEKMIKITGYLFCRSAPPKDVQLFAETKCPEIGEI